MIYLIGGAPRCGKTILAKRIARQKNIPWISTDIIRSVVLAYSKKSQINKMFPYEKVSLGKDPVVDLLRAEITESKSLWPGVQTFIEHLIDCKEDYIIEGVHLMPKLVNELRGTKRWRKVRLIYLIKDDLVKIKKGLQQNTAMHDWLAGALKNNDTLEKAAKMIQVKSRYISKTAQKYRFKVVNIDDDFNTKINKIEL